VADAKMPKKLGRYEIVRELGKGAMGVVYEGKDPNIGRRVAIKTARREVVEASGMADEMMERFLREAQAAGALNHPNIITIYDAAEENGIAYIAMEFLEGGDLGDVIDTKRKLGMEEIVDIGASICEALDVAHTKGVVHRDIKPANILMPTGQPLKVADFGIAHVSDSNLTQDGALIGTPHYMSPEQFMGQKLDGRSDLFSVGNILYELTTGEKPFGGEALSTVMHHVIKTDPVSPTELNFNVPDALAQVIMTALSKRPANRYATGKAMAEALRESIKANPDPAILAPGGAALGATVPGGAAAANQATVVGAVPNVGATLPGGAPGTQETTVMGNPPPQDATLPGAAPLAATAPGGAPGGATVPGGAPPAATAAGEAAAMTATGTGGTVAGHALPGTGPNKGLLFGGIAAAVVIVIGALFALSGGSGNSESPAATPGSGAAGTEQPYYGKIRFDVWQAKDDETYRAHVRDKVPLGELGGRLDPLDSIAVKVYDGDGSLIASEESWNPMEELTFSEDARPRALRCSITVDGLTQDFDIPLAKSVGETATPEGIVIAPATRS